MAPFARLALAGAVVSTALLAPSIAAAQARPEPYPTCSRKVDQAESEAAHVKYLSGKVDYDEGKHDAAIHQFRQAYAKDCTKHELLIIIARAYEFKNDLPEAIRALETYLQRVPDSPDAATHRSRIETLRAKLATQPASAETAGTSTPAPGPTAVQAPPSEPSESRGHTIYPWIVVGAGVATVAVGVVLLATAPALPEGCDADTRKCERLGRTDAQLQEAQDAAGRSQGQPLAGGIVAGAGGALIVGGLLWHFLEPTSGERSSAPTETGKPKLTPHVGFGFTGLSLAGKF